MLKEFKTFAMKGNVVDMAVGIVLGMAFGNIVNSLVNDILMPPLGLLLGDVDFSNLYLNLSSTSYESLKAAQAAGAPTLNYGVFVNTVVNFLILAFALFLFIRQINRFRVPEQASEPAEPSTRECPHCLRTISARATRCPECTSELSGSE